MLLAGDGRGKREGKDAAISHGWHRAPGCSLEMPCSTDVVVMAAGMRGEGKLRLQSLCTDATEAQLWVETQVPRGDTGLGLGDLAHAHRSDPPLRPALHSHLWPETVQAAPVPHQRRPLRRHHLPPLAGRDLRQEQAVPGRAVSMWGDPDQLLLGAVGCPLLPREVGMRAQRAGLPTKASDQAGYRRASSRLFLRQVPDSPSQGGPGQDIPSGPWRGGADV